MSQKKERNKVRQIGKKLPEKKYLINPKYKNFFWTIVIIVILLIFFIVNNTRSVPERGPYPPTYNPAGSQKPDTTVNYKIDLKKEKTD
ncbi:MAG TPA: hypothetical protein VMT35_01780 [Ignavibacteriaceae bacterium]|nr:hypothetical protein [Ignavibacteriaceae bacterium]